MKKIPTLFERVYKDHKIIDILPNITPGLEYIMHGEGLATIKIDGSCVAIINGEFYKRYDAKKGKKAPKDAIPCCAPDPITGHHPHWIKVTDSPENKWYINAYNNTPKRADGTYEAIGPHFQGNPYGLSDDILEPHGVKIVEVERTFDGIKRYLTDNYIEGLVFWHKGSPVCKIKRSDFGLDWNNRGNNDELYEKRSD